MTAKERNEEEEDKDHQPKIESFDDILPYIGEAGRYQWFLFLILLPFTVVYAFLYFVQFFLTLVPEEHWCRIPEFEDTNLTDWQKIEFSVPPKSLVAKHESESYFPYSRCYMYNITNYKDLLIKGEKPGLDTPIEKCQHGWSYNQTSVPYISLGAELEWVCDKTHLGTTAQSIFFLGSIVGGFIFGYMADHYGRRPALIACNTVGLLASIGTAFCNSYWSFVLARFITGTSFDNCFNILFIIVMEYVGPKHRTLMLNLSLGIYFAFAASLLPWIAYWIANWKVLTIVCALPLTVVLISPWIVPESARWYIQNGRIDEAVEIVKKLARVNRKTIPKEVYAEFKESCKAMKDSHENCTLLDLFKLSRLRRITVVLIINWLLIVFIFDGHIWNMKSLHPNVFVSFSLASISELPAAILINFLLDIWGRRWMCALSMFICGVFSFIALAMPIGSSAMWMAAMARLGVNVAINICFQHAAELLPTVVRVQGISLIHIIGYLAHTMGPSVILLANVTPWLPLVLLGSLAFICVALTLTLPETMDQQMPDTLEEGNNFGKEQNFWWIPCINSKMYNSVKKSDIEL